MKSFARRFPRIYGAGKAAYHRLHPEKADVARVDRSPGGFQPWPTTFENRYPELFARLADELSGLKRPRVLSFGCASGEEVRALSCYLPSAQITGVDANARAIRAAKDADREGRAQYVVGYSPPAGERYDAILAMAVFRHGTVDTKRPDDCSPYLRFDRFENALERLDAALKPGGWIAIGHAQMRFRDTRLMKTYCAQEDFSAGLPPMDLLYGRDNRRIEGATESAVLFRKSGDLAEM